MKAELPDSELVTQPSGHMGLMEQNQWFAEAVSASVLPAPQLN